MVLAAGLGMRMRPLSEAVPKCLLPVAGRAPLDRVLDRLAAAGVERAVVNLHHQADAIRHHLAGRTAPEIAFSDESRALLDTGGGVAKALPQLGEGPLLVVNAISLWRDAGAESLCRLAAAFEPERMDALLLLHPVANAIGYDGPGDFALAADGRLARRRPGASALHVFIGVQLLSPALFDDAPAGAFSLNLVYDRAAAAGRLHGLEHHGTWVNLKTPEALAAAERALAAGAP
jgi:MurNAc alpha-1-phosphate uridylyltransferase